MKPTTEVVASVEPGAMQAEVAEGAIALEVAPQLDVAADAFHLEAPITVDIPIDTQPPADALKYFADAMAAAVVQVGEAGAQAVLVVGEQAARRADERAEAGVAEVTTRLDDMWSEARIALWILTATLTLFLLAASFERITNNRRGSAT